MLPPVNYLSPGMP